MPFLSRRPNAQVTLRTRWATVDGRYCTIYDHQLTMNMKETMSKYGITLATNTIPQVVLNI